jgi:hypothetical protein
MRAFGRTGERRRIALIELLNGQPDNGQPGLGAQAKLVIGTRESTVIQQQLYIDSGNPAEAGTQQ